MEGGVGSTKCCQNRCLVLLVLPKPLSCAFSVAKTAVLCVGGD